MGFNLSSHHGHGGAEMVWSMDLLVAIRRTPVS